MTSRSVLYFKRRRCASLLILCVCLTVTVYLVKQYIYAAVREQWLCFQYVHDKKRLESKVEELFSKGRQATGTKHLHLLDPKSRVESLNVKTVKGELESLLGPITMYTYGRSDFISRSILDYGEWESTARRTIEQILMNDKNLHFLDFGSNIGVFALTAAKHGRQVVAVDANRNNLNLLSLSLSANANFSERVTLVNNALSNEYGQVRLNVVKENIGGSGVVKMDNSSKTNDLIDSILVDDLLPYIQFKRAIMKIDIEGFEHFALAGAQKLFDKIDVPYVLFEWYSHIYTLARNKDHLGAYFLDRFFKERGYRPYSLRIPGRQMPLPSFYCFWSYDVLMKKVKT